MTQYEQVIEVMKRNGGFATLGYLNNSVDVSEWITKTPFATIRRIVQDGRFFFKIKPGLWALKSFKEEVLLKFNIADKKNIETIEEFNHSYYQGLLSEIGNLKGLMTFFPNNFSFLVPGPRNKNPIKNYPHYQTCHYCNLRMPA